MRKQYIVVTPFFPSPDNWRGAYCFDFVRALQRELEKVGAIERSEIAEGLRGQWKVLVFVPGAGEDYEIGGVKVYRFPTRQLPSNILPFLFHRYNERSFLNKLKEVLIPLSTSTSDLGLFSEVAVCHGHTANFAIYPLALKRLNPDCQTLLHHHDLMSFGLNNGRLKHCGLYNRYLARQLKCLHEQIDCHVFISRLCQRSFETFPNIEWLGDADYSAQARGVKHMAPVRIKRSIILHNGVDTSIFHPAEKKDDNSALQLQLSTTTKPFTIGCVGNIEREKGQYDLLCALKILQDAGKKVRCLFVGSGPDKVRCETFAKTHQLDVEFLQEMRHEQLPAFYHQLDLFVLPTWLDGFGCVYTEAYACGVPFIASENAGVEDMIPDAERSLWLCKKCDPEDLSAKILYYIRCRPVQRMQSPIDVTTLASEFAKSVGSTVNAVKLTVVTATWNAIRHGRRDDLVRCIQSVADLPFAHEHRVYDGGSDDGTVDLLNEMMHKIGASLRVVSEKDSGLYDALNKGLRDARGDWFYVLGDDDRIIDAGALNSLIENAEQSKCMMAIAPVEKASRGYSAIVPKHMLGGMGYCHQGVLVKTCCMRRLGGFNLRYRIAADFDVCLRLHLNNTKAYCDSKCFAYYRDSAGVSTTNDEKLRHDNAMVLANNLRIPDANLPYMERLRVLPIGVSLRLLFHRDLFIRKSAMHQIIKAIALKVGVLNQ